MTAVFGETAGRKGRNFLPVQKNGARGAAVHATQHIEDGGLAGTGGTYDHAEFALFDGEGHAVDGIDLLLAYGVFFDNILEFDKTHGENHL